MEQNERFGIRSAQLLPAHLAETRRVGGGQLPIVHVLPPGALTNRLGPTTVAASPDFARHGTGTQVRSFNSHPQWTRAPAGRAREPPPLSQVRRCAGSVVK
ncbi:hypothetical protein GCM10009533_44600 [Saccharopolyspora spinosporotrichia]|uniref:Uncharacterized protein n=1 Tax=Saccharopolyspora erythraea TaxID=1836 RepID=A0ABN1DDY5_SACER